VRVWEREHTFSRDNKWSNQGVMMKVLISWWILGRIKSTPAHVLAHKMPVRTREEVVMERGGERMRKWRGCPWCSTKVSNFGERVFCVVLLLCQITTLCHLHFYNRKLR